MEHRSTSSEPKRILVVDDNELSGRLLWSILTKAGYEVEICADGSEAIEKIEANPTFYHLILTDLLMPMMSGFDFIGHIKRLGQIDNFFVVSSMRDNESILKAKNLGASAYITKPSRSGDILEKVDHYFNTQAGHCGTAGNF